MKRFFVAAALAAITFFSSKTGRAQESLYVASFVSKSISRVAMDGTVTPFISGIQAPVSMYFDAQDNIFLTELPTPMENGPTTVRKIDAVGNMNIVAVFPGVLADIIGDAQGNLFVTNYGVHTGVWDNRLSKIAPDGSVSVFATIGNGPNGLAFDAAGLLYVTEWTGGLRAIAPNGTIRTLATNLNIPGGPTFDAAGNLYVCEAGAVPGHGRILKYTFSSPGVVSSSSVVMTDNGLDRPRRMAFDEAGNLYVANVGNYNNAHYTILRITPSGNVSTFLRQEDYPEDIAIHRSLPLRSSVNGQIVLQDAINKAQPVTFEFRPTDGSAGFQRNVTLRTDGTYSLPNIPRKQYMVRAKGAKWLAQTFSVNTSADIFLDANASLLAGDANNDNYADISDLLLLVAHYNKVSPNAGFSEAADFNCDGGNDIADLLLLIANYNKQGDV